MNHTRRSFIKKTSLGTMALGGFTSTSLISENVLGSNDRINCAVIGVRSRAKAHVLAIHGQKNTKILYSCDVDDLILEEHNIWSKNNIGYVPKNEKDFRKIKKF